MIGHCARCGREGDVKASRERSSISGKLRDVLVCAGRCKEDHLRSETFVPNSVEDGGRHLRKRGGGHLEDI